MCAKFILLLTLVFVINEVNSKCSKGQNETMCWAVLCPYIEYCSKCEILVEADPKNCICCRKCEKFNTPSNCCSHSDSDSNESNRCSDTMTPELCHAADCRPVEKCEKGQHFVKADYSKCICCDYCADDCISY